MNEAEKVLITILDKVQDTLNELDIPTELKENICAGIKDYIEECVIKFYEDKNNKESSD